MNTNGTNVSDGTYSIVFSIYSVASAGTAIWTETQSVTVSNGIFQVNLGSVTALPGSVDFNTDNIYLGIKVGADAEMTPRIQFTSVPQAFNSEKLGGLDKAGFIQNQTGTAQAASFNINGTAVIGSSVTAPTLQSAGGAALTITGNAASTWSTSAGNLTIQAGSGTVSLGSTTTLSSTGALTISSGTGTNAITLDSGGTGSVNIGTGGNGKTIQLGNTSSAVTQTINIGTNATASSSTSVTIGSTVAGSTTIQNSATVNLNAPSIVSNASTLNLFNSGTGSINFGGAATSMSIGPGGATAATLNLVGGSGATGCTVDGATGNFTCSGLLSGSAVNVKGYTTSNTSSTNSGQWTKLASCSLTVQYRDCRTQTQIAATADGGSFDRATLDVRVKQQNAMAGVPYIRLDLDSNAIGITTSDITAVTTQNDATATVVEVWGRINSTFRVWNMSPSINTGTDQFTWYSNQGFSVSLPAGTTTTPTYTATITDSVSVNGTSVVSSGRALQNITGYAQSSGNATFNQNATDQLKVVALQAPTSDMVNISNAGFPITTDQINGQQIDYYAALGTSTYQSSGLRVNITNTSATAGSTTNGLRVVATGAVAGTTNGIKIDGFTSGAGGASALYVGSGWKDLLNLNGTQIISGTGILQSTALAGTYSNAISFTNTSNTFTGDGAGLTNLNGTNIATGTVANARLVNSGTLSVSAGTGLTGGGSVALGGSTTLSLATSGTGAAFVQGGNSFGAQAVLGTNDANSIAIRTGNANRIIIDTSGNMQFQQASTISTSSGNLSLSAAGTGTATLDTGGAGTVTVGTNATTVNVGNGTGNNTVNIVNNTGTNTLNAGTNSNGANTLRFGGTGSSGASNSGTTVLLQGGQSALSVANGGITVQTFANSVNGFQVTNSFSNPVFMIDTTSTNTSGQVNYLAYPSFDSGSVTNASAGWIKTGAATATLNTNLTNTYDGIASAQVATTAVAGDGITTSSFSIAPNTTGAWIISFYAKISSGSMAGNLFTVTSTDGVAHSCSPSAAVTITSSGFNRLSCTVTTTAPITALSIAQNDAVARTLYIDAVQLQRGTTATPYQAGAVQIRGVVITPMSFVGTSDSTTAFQIQNANSSSNLFVADTLNSRIGIGTNTPSYALDVNGQLRASSTANSIFGNGTTGGIQIGDSTLTKTSGGFFQLGSSLNASGYQVSGAASTGSYLRGNGTSYVSSSLLASDLSGTVGIGNGGTGNTSYTSSGVLYYNGTIFTSTAASTGAQCLISASAGAAPTWGSCNNGSGAFVQNGNSFGATAFLGTNDLNSLSFETNGVTRTTIDTSGNLTQTGTLTIQGAGTNTFSGSISVTGSATVGSLVVGPTLSSTIASTTIKSNAGALGTTAGNELAVASFGFTASNASSFGVRAYRTGAGTDWTTSSIVLGMDVDSTVRAGAYLSLGSSSRFTGINNLSPQYAMDVSGDVNASGNIRTGGTVRLSNAGVISNITGYTQNSGNATFNQNAADQFKIAALQAPTSDMAYITNSGFPVTTGGINGLQVDYFGGAAAVESGAIRLNVNPGSTSGGIWNGLRVTSNATGPATGVTLNGAKFEGPSVQGAGTQNALYFDTNWNNILNVGGTSVLTATRVLQNVTANTSILTAGTLGIGRGGTGGTSYTNTGVIYFNGSNFVSTAASTGSQCLISASAGAAPTWGSCGTGSPGGSFIQGGNTFTAQAVLGTNDAFGIALRTNSINRIQIDTSGNLQFQQGSSITTSTGNLTLDTPNGATIDIGANSSTINIAGGGSVVASTVNLNTGGNSSNTTNIASSNTSTNVVTLGSLFGAGSVAIRSGSGGINLTSNGSAGTTVAPNADTLNAFVVQNAAAAQILRVGTVDNNLLDGLNNNFEDNPITNWTGRNGGSIARITNYRYTGLSSGEVTTTATVGSGVKLNYAFSPNTQYTFSLYARSLGGAINTVAIGRQEVSGTDIDCATGLGLQTIGWRRFSCTFSTGATITSSNLYIKQTDAVARAGKIIIDSVQLDTGPNANAYGQGAVSYNAVVNSSLALQSTGNSTTAFTVQRSDGSMLLNADTMFNGVAIGTDDAAGYLLNVAGTANFATSITTPTVTSSGNLTISPNGGSSHVLISPTGGGRLGIANSAPNTLLHVGSSTQASGAIATFQTTAASCTVTPATTTAFACTSDRRLKKDINSIDGNILDSLLGLQAVKYHYNSEDDSEQLHTGFIAQDVMKDFPDLVVQDPNTGYLSLAYSGLIPYMVKGMQEQQAIINTLNGNQQGIYARMDAMLNSDADLHIRSVVATTASFSTLTVEGPVLIRGDLVARSASFEGSILVGGKLVLGGKIPVVQAGAATDANTSDQNLPQVSVDGTDSAGTLLVTASKEGGTTGVLADIVFAEPFAADTAFKVSLTPTNDSALDLRVYVEKTSNGFRIITRDPAKASTSYSFDYLVFGAKAVVVRQ